MKITKSQLRKMIKEELSLIMEEETDMSAKGLVKRTQDLYNDYTTNGFDESSRSKIQAIFDDLQATKTKHFEEKGKDEEYETLMKLWYVTHEMSKAVHYKDLSLLGRGNFAAGTGIPAEPNMSWLMSQ
jgi:hypothetical protein